MRARSVSTGWGGRVLWVGLAAGIAALLLRVVPALLENQTLHLADGREIEIKGVTFGVEHRFVQGRAWVKMFGPIMGSRWAAQHGLLVMKQRSATPTLMVWMASRWLLATNGPLGEASVVDEQGRETELLPWADQIYLTPTAALSGVKLSSFPRRDRFIHLRLYSRDKSYLPHRVAEFRLRNPARGGFPNWVPEALPVTKRVGKLDFTLTSLSTQGFTAPGATTAGVGAGPWTSAAFRISEGGVPTRGWRARDMEASDATGNYSHPFIRSWDATNELDRFGMKGLLWPEEGAWKLKVEFCRSTNFLSEDLWSLKAVPIPATETPVALDGRTNIHGVELGAIEMRIVRENLPFRLRKLRRKVELTVKMSPTNKGLNLSLAGVVDERGHAVACELVYAAPDGLHNFAIFVPTESQRVDLTFAVHASVFVEYLARPEWAEAGAGPK